MMLSVVLGLLIADFLICIAYGIKQILEYDAPPKERVVYAVKIISSFILFAALLGFMAHVIIPLLQGLLRT